MRDNQREQIRQGTNKDKGLQVADSDDESPGSGSLDASEEKKREDDLADSEHQKDYEKKRKKKTKEDIEKEALLMGDLYAILGLEDKTFEASEA